MPDDAALGEFREIFAGLLGTIEEYPTKASADYAGFHDAIDIVYLANCNYRLKTGG